MTIAAYGLAGALFAGLEAGAYEVASPGASRLGPVGVIGAPLAGGAAGAGVFAVREGLQLLRRMPKPAQAGFVAVAALGVNQALKSSTRHVDRNE